MYLWWWWLVTLLAVTSGREVVFREVGPWRAGLPSCPRLSCTGRLSTSRSEVGSGVVVLANDDGDLMVNETEAAVVVALDLSVTPAPRVYRPRDPRSGRAPELAVSRRGPADLTPTPWRLDPLLPGQDAPEVDHVVEEWKTKRPEIVWCQNTGDQDPAPMFLVEELAEHTQVVVQDCTVEEAADRFRFVLIFEPTLCEGRIADDVYKVLARHAIPVVFGFLHYSALPPVSFIHALAMPPSFLSEHLAEVTSDDPGRYFGWLRHWRLVYDSDRWFCELCELLTTPREVWYENREVETCHMYDGDGFFTINWIE